MVHNPVNITLWAHWTVLFKWLNYVICGLYLNKLIFFKKSAIRIRMLPEESFVQPEMQDKLFPTPPLSCSITAASYLFSLVQPTVVFLLPPTVSHLCTQQKFSKLPDHFFFFKESPSCTLASKFNCIWFHFLGNFTMTICLLRLKGCQ